MVVDTYCRAVDPHSLFADLDPAVFLMRIQIQLKHICKKLPYEEFSVVNKKDCSKVKKKNHGAGSNLL